MECNKCGVDTTLVPNGDGLVFCDNCISFESSSELVKYKLAIGVHKIQFVLLVLLDAFIVSGLFSRSGPVLKLDIIVLCVPLFFAVLHLLIIKGLKKEKVWAGVSSLLMNLIVLFAFPIGTLLGGMAIYSVVKSWRF